MCVHEYRWRLISQGVWPAGVIIVSSVLAASPAQQPVFIARTTAVQVDVAVTSGGRPLLGLAASDFEVFDNGVRQQIDFVSADTVPISLTLVLDLSGSVTVDRLGHFRRATEKVIGSLRSNDRAALLTFNHAVTFHTARTIDELQITAVLMPGGSGGTALFDAAYVALVLTEIADHRGIVLIFSDGIDTTSWLSPAVVLETAKRGQAVVYAVSASRRNSSFLRDLAAATGGSHLSVISSEELGTVLTEILDTFRQRYLLLYRPRNVSPSGWHRIDVRVRRDRVAVTARPGYLVGTGR